MCWKRILLAFLLIILAGCEHLQTRQVAPIKPTLTVMESPDGGMCLDRVNTEKLGAYILNLERAVK